MTRLRLQRALGSAWLKETKEEKGKWCGINSITFGVILNKGKLRSEFYVMIGLGPLPVESKANLYRYKTCLIKMSEYQSFLWN